MNPKQDLPAEGDEEVIREAEIHQISDYRERKRMREKEAAEKTAEKTVEKPTEASPKKSDVKNSDLDPSI